MDCLMQHGQWLSMMVLRHGNAFPITGHLWRESFLTNSLFWRFWWHHMIRAMTIFLAQTIAWVAFFQLKLRQEVWDVFCEDFFLENWPRYNGTALYTQISNTTTGVWYLINKSETGLSYGRRYNYLLCAKKLCGRKYIQDSITRQLYANRKYI